MNDEEWAISEALADLDGKACDSDYYEQTSPDFNGTNDAGFEPAALDAEMRAKCSDYEAREPPTYGGMWK